ncbi:hypothetical protein, partial [Weizmannia acidilactici]|uniref:hypothetical protein n=1 Tax=Weizmannia acidilactici TaxID=2607726 RepID=UPI001C129AF3
HQKSRRIPQDKGAKSFCRPRMTKSQIDVFGARPENIKDSLVKEQPFNWKLTHLVGSKLYYTRVSGNTR